MTSPSCIRVAVDATPTLGRRTGIGVFTAGLLRALTERDDVGVRPYAVTWRGRHGVPGAQRLPMPARLLRRLWRSADHPVVEWWTGTVDVVHGTNFVVPPARRAAEVVSVHDLTAVRFPELCTPDTLEYPGLIRRALRRGAMVHADSGTVADEIVEWSGVAAERVRVVHPGLAPASAPVRPVACRPGGPPYILALGTIEPRKDHASLVRAFTLLAAGHPDLRLVVAGPPGWGSAALDGAIAAAPPDVRARVDRPGWLDDPTRAALVAGAAVFAYPSVYEGFGFPPLEAMAAGTPVVATVAGSLPEVLGDAAVLVPVGDADALAAAIDGVLGGTGVDGLVARGRRRAAGYRWDRCAASMVALYRDAALHR